MTTRIGHECRREFLQQAGLAAGGWLAAHAALAAEPKDISSRKADAQASFADPRNRVAPTEPGDPRKPRILALRLLTATSLATMREFYRDRIGFAVTAESPTEVTFAAGATALTFVAAKPGQIHSEGGRGNGEPMYHFAFNIPRNAVRAARVWQLQRSALVPPRRELRDPAHADDVWHFRHWNAHSLFFFDPAYNIVEYIARHDLALESDDPVAFGTRDIVYASEIGFVFADGDRTPDEVPAATRTITERLGLQAYPRDAAPWAMGDERGLLLCLARKGKIWGEHTPTPVTWDVFETRVTISGPRDGTLRFDGKPYEVTVG